jgi:hypothetical protein
MFYQYGAQRTRRHTFPSGYQVRVGTVPVGTIVYIQDGLRPLGGFRGPFVFRNPYIVESWHNREYFPAIKGQHPHKVYMQGGHLATVRSLRDGRRHQVADWVLLASLGDGF